MSFRILLLFSLVIICLITTGSSASYPKVPTNESLEHLLCNGTITSNNVYRVSDEIINQGYFCLVKNITNVHIVGAEGKAVIQCKSDSADVTSRGFGFHDVSNFTLRDIEFHNCGSPISPKPSNDSHSYLYFQTEQSAVLYFNNSRDVTIENVVITHYTGFAILGINICGHSALTEVVVEDSLLFSSTSCAADEHRNSEFPTSCQHTSACVGSGVFLYYRDTESTIISDTHLLVEYSKFNRNYNYVNFTYFPDVLDVLTKPTELQMPIVGGGALTVIFDHVHSNVHVSVEHSTFERNCALNLGAVMLYYTSEPSIYGSVWFTDCMFQYNGAHSQVPTYVGYAANSITAAIKFYNHNGSDSSTSSPILGEYECLKISGMSFNSSLSYGPYVTVLQFPGSEDTCKIVQEEVWCNDLSVTGTCFYAHDFSANHDLNIELIDVSSIHKSPTLAEYRNPNNGVFTFVNIGQVVVSGTGENSSVFDGNAGPVLIADATELLLTGHLIFRANQAYYSSGGAAILVRANAHLIFQEPLHAVFDNNNGTYGGAIYAAESNLDACVFQFYSSNRSTYTAANISSMNIRIFFSNNNAMLAGNAIYAAPIYSCNPYFSSPVRLISIPEVYESLFHFDATENPNNLSDVSSAAALLCSCSSQINNPKNCTIPGSILAYPGGTFSLSLLVLDDNNRTVYATVTASLKTHSGATWRLASGQDSVQLFGDRCNEISFTIYSRDEPDTGLLFIRPVSLTSSFYVPPVIELNLIECPLGFTRTDDGSCTCSHLLTVHDIKCDIDSVSVSRSRNVWLGPVFNNSAVGYSSNCPPGYCKEAMKQVDITHEDDLCLSNHTGILCGRCSHGLSTIFGSSLCKKCSSFWILTLPVYMVAGIGLVLLLFLLHLTISKGTINGLVFYANVLSINSLLFLGHPNLEWLLIFISFINLELGFPVCFYDGMNNLGKTFLQFLFPVYIWSIVLVLVFWSRYSSRVTKLIGTSSVQVLATLVFLSYSKLLRTVVDAIAYASVELSLEGGANEKTSTVWYLDGNVQYGSGLHIFLLSLAIITLVIFLAPYTVFFSGVNAFAKVRLVNKYMPMIDAHCGAYKHKWRFWYGARLCVLAIIFLVYAILKGNDASLLLLVEAIVLVAFILIQMHIKPFRNFTINLLDMFFMVNAFLLAVFAIYYQGEQTDSFHALSGLLVGSAFLTFLGIVLYHGYIAIRGERRRDAASCQHATNERLKIMGRDSTSAQGQCLGGIESSYQSDVLREPLVESLND